MVGIVMVQTPQYSLPDGQQGLVETVWLEQTRKVGEALVCWQT